MGIALNEIKRRKWSTIWWSVGIALFIALVFAIYPSFRSSSAQLDKSLQNIPESARNLFTDTNDFLSPVGYLSSQCYYLMLPLLFGFLAIALGSSLLAREEQDGTLELLLARPVSRSRIILAKAAAGTAILIAVGLVIAALGAILCQVIGFPGVKTIGVFYTTIMCLDFALLFGALALVMTALGRVGRGGAIGLSTLLALAGYLFSSLDKTVSWLVWPARLLPFHYYHPADILRSGSFPYWDAAGMFIASLILLALALLAFRRRDIG
ncbi:MAG TPA: ABC transporter permease subunit [Candidatus Saccharimonadales bacterium]|nr:ABC transporter permease subunit [Candidatus Saccharimonadales bacterium]